MISIKFNDVDVEFDLGATRRLFKRLTATLELEPGEILGLMGESGSGKSTLLRLLAGVQPCSAGCISSTGLLKGDIAYLPQGGVLLEHLSLRENLLLFSRLKVTKNRYSQKRLEAAITALDLKSLYESNAPVSSLSGGERQRISIARVLSIEPRLLLLDEPCSAIGGDHRTELLAALKKSAVELNFAVILASHDWDDHIFCANRIAFLHHTNGTGLKSLSIVRVSEFAHEPWHREAVAYTAGAPINWIEAKQNENGWVLSSGGLPLGQAEIDLVPHQNGVVEQGSAKSSHLLLACTPHKFSRTETVLQDSRWKAIGKSDLYAFVQIGAGILVIDNSISEQPLSLKIAGQIPAYSISGTLLGIARVNESVPFS